MNISVAGICFGLIAALGQSMSYLATRHFTQRRKAEAVADEAAAEGAGMSGGNISLLLLVLSHVMMGVVSVALWPFFSPNNLPPVGLWAWPLTCVALFYLIGQVGLMIALHYAEPSRISPMLGFKIVILAGAASVIGTHAPTALQWLAVVLCCVSVVGLNYTGGASHPRAVFGVILACVSYCISDWNITVFVNQLTIAHVASAPIVAALLCYAVCGLIGAAFLPWFGSRRWVDWRDAAPFALSWLFAIFFLFACFGLVGVVFGNILQATRGLMSIGLGALLIRLGHHHLERKVPHTVVLRRAVGAVLIFAAIVIYKLEAVTAPSAPATTRAAPLPSR